MLRSPCPTVWTLDGGSWSDVFVEPVVFECFNELLSLVGLPSESLSKGGSSQSELNGELFRS
mgnify:CR=1 FL=1